MGWPDNCNFHPSLVGLNSGQNKKQTNVDGGLMSVRRERPAGPSLIGWEVSCSRSCFPLQLILHRADSAISEFCTCSGSPHKAFKNSWIINLTRGNSPKWTVSPVKNDSNSPYSGKQLSACWRFKSFSSVRPTASNVLQKCNQVLHSASW